MKTLEAAKAKAKCSSRMEDVFFFLEFAKKRELGALEKKGTVEFSKDWHISDEELCGVKRMCRARGGIRLEISGNKIPEHLLLYLRSAFKGIKISLASNEAIDDQSDMFGSD
jgi:hypothetical protein